MALASNSLEGKAEKYLQRIETLLDEVATAKGECGQVCKGLHEDVRAIYTEAKENGVPVRTLKGVVKDRQLQKQRATIKDSMDIGEWALFETLIEALGPLGMAAARAAGHAPRDDGPSHWEDAASRRADQEHLDKLGRGPIS